MPDSDSQMGCGEKSRSPPYRDNAVYRDSHTLISPMLPYRPPTSGSSPDFSTFTFTGNMVGVWGLASWVREAQKSLRSQVKARGRRGEVKGKLRVWAVLRPEQCPVATAAEAATSASSPSVGGPFGSPLFPLVNATVNLVPWPIHSCRCRFPALSPTFLGWGWSRFPETNQQYPRALPGRCSSSSRDSAEVRAPAPREARWETKDRSVARLLGTYSIRRFE